MAFVFGAIAPHGGLAIPEACAPGERNVARATREGMTELGRLFLGSRPDVVIVATPHNVHISGRLGVVVAGRLAGELGDTPSKVALDVPSEPQLAWELLRAFGRAGLPAAAVGFGSNDEAGAVAPLDWGTLIPLWFMGGREDPPVPAVIVTPSRDLPARAHVLAGRAIARVASRHRGRVAFIASADHGHAHKKDGPYGYHPDASVYDAMICDLVSSGRLDRLVGIEPRLVERAKADSWWQLLMLLGATAGWTGRLISYEAPTYFGMLTAVYSPPRRG